LHNGLFDIFLRNQEREEKMRSKNMFYSGIVLLFLTFLPIGIYIGMYMFVIILLILAMCVLWIGFVAYLIIEGLGK
jgi:hypothetical protein